MTKIKNIRVLIYALFFGSVLLRICIILSSQDVIIVSKELSLIFNLLSNLLLFLWYVLLDRTNEEKYSYSKPKGKVFYSDPVRRYRRLKRVVKYLLAANTLFVPAAIISINSLSPPPTLNFQTIFVLVIGLTGILLDFFITPVIALWCFFSGKRLEKKLR